MGVLVVLVLILGFEKNVVFFFFNHFFIDNFTVLSKIKETFFFF